MYPRAVDGAWSLDGDGAMGNWEATCSVRVLYLLLLLLLQLLLPHNTRHTQPKKDCGCVQLMAYILSGYNTVQQTVPLS